MTSVSVSPRAVASGSRSTPTALAAEPFSMRDLPALMSYSEEVLDHLDLNEEAFAAGEIDDNELIDEIERQTASLTRQLERAQEALQQEAGEYQSKCATLTRKNKKLHEALVHAREKLLALREVKNYEGHSAEDEDPPVPPPRPPRGRRSGNKHI